MNPAPTMTAVRDRLVDHGLDAVDVLEIPQREDARQVDPRDGRAERGGAGREDQLVVGLVVLAGPPGGRGRGRSSGRPIDGLDLGSGADVEPVAPVRSHRASATRSFSRSAISPPR